MVAVQPGTLLELLAGDLADWMAKAADGLPRRVLLWLDPERQFGRLAPHLEGILQTRGVRLMVCEPEEGKGQFAIKLALLELEGTKDGKAVVYLPGFPREALEPEPDGGLTRLWALYEYRYKGSVWGVAERWEPGAVPDPPALLGWLRRHGVAFADDRTAQRLGVGGHDSLLARYAEQQRCRSPSDWPRPVRYSDVEEALAGDPRDHLRRLLAAPNNEVKRWGDERFLVLEHIATEYGLVPPDVDATPEALADAFALQLALAEAWDVFGRPKDFPFLSRLPEDGERRRRQAEFLREEVVVHTELGPRFLKRMEGLEAQYNLGQWAAGRSGQPAGLPRLARSRWQAMMGRLQEAGDKGWNEAVALLFGERDAIETAAAGRWDGTDVGAAWWLLRDLAELAEQSRAAVSEAQTAKATAEQVAAYAGRWWHIDWLHLRIRAACSRHAGLETVRHVVDLAYFDYASRVNQCFTDLVEQEKAWPPRNTADVSGVREALWQAGKGRRAVLVVDALRWDLAQQTREQLGEGCSLDPLIATLPTKTAFGMAVLLPLDEQKVAVEFPSADEVITQADSGNLAELGNRKRFLEGSIKPQDGRPRIQFMTLEELLKGAKVPNQPLLVVLDHTIDEQGHKGTEELPALAEHMVARVKQGIERLHAAGVSTVHVVTDHGFLLLPGEAVDALGRPEVPISHVVAREERWAALKPDAPTTDVFTLPLPLMPSQTLGFPRGVRTLVKAPDYLHGGISLQECVIPHLESRVTTAQPRLKVDVRVSTDQLSGGTVPVILRPLIPEGQAPLAGIASLAVRLWVDTVPPKGMPLRRVTEVMDIQLRQDGEDLRPGVYLQEGLGLKAGQDLVLQAVDKETGESLASVLLKLLVDWV